MSQRPGQRGGPAHGRKAVRHGAAARGRGREDQGGRHVTRRSAAGPSRWTRTRCRARAARRSSKPTSPRAVLPQEPEDKLPELRQALRVEWTLCPYCNTSTAAETNPTPRPPVKVEVAVSMPAPGASTGPSAPAAEAVAARPPPRASRRHAGSRTGRGNLPSNGRHRPIASSRPNRSTWAEFPAAGPKAGRRPLRALVVDDDPEHQDDRDGHAPQDGHTDRSRAGAGRHRGARKAREATPDLAVLDVMMRAWRVRDVPRPSRERSDRVRADPDADGERRPGQPHQGLSHRQPTTTWPSLFCRWT